MAAAHFELIVFIEKEIVDFHHLHSRKKKHEKNEKSEELVLDLIWKLL